MDIGKLSNQETTAIRRPKPSEKSATIVRKLRNRPKIRNLVEKSNDNEIAVIEPKIKRHYPVKRIILWSLIIMLAVLILYSHYYGNANGNNYIQNFLTSYRMHYNQIVHGKKDYCDRTLNVKALFSRIRLHQIINQEDTLQQLELALRNNSRVNAIAVVGSSGLGKSLWARALEEHFPWQDNVHTYAWNTYVRDEAEKFHVLRMYVETLSECGRNLIVIENLSPCDLEVVNIFNNLISELKDAEKVHVIIIYIFKLNTMDMKDSTAVYSNNINELQNLPNTKTINFRQFNKDDLMNCIEREARAENISLNPADINEIVDSIDVRQSGCKNVHARVLLQAKQESQGWF